MIKIANIKSVWPTIYQKLKSPPSGLSLGDFPSKLPPINNIIFDDNLSKEPNAIGYVSTEDVDNNGKIDVIHISSPKLEEVFRQSGIKQEQLTNLNSLNNQQLQSVLIPFVELISHELGHINDYKHENENKFPGGEGVAENAAQNAVNKISLNSANIQNKLDKSGAHIMDINLFTVLSKLAGRMDKAGHTHISDHIDVMIRKYSQEMAFNSMKDPASQEPDMTDNSSGISTSINDLQNPSKEKGQIVRPGDSYSYDLSPDGGFVVVTAPVNMQHVIGFKIKAGEPGYAELMADASRLGLMRDNKVAKVKRAQESAFNSMKDSSGQEPDMADNSSGMSGLLNRINNPSKAKGKIVRPGDPYSYDLSPEGGFSKVPVQSQPQSRAVLSREDELTVKLGLSEADKTFEKLDSLILSKQQEFNKELNSFADKVITMVPSTTIDSAQLVPQLDLLRAPGLSGQDAQKIFSGAIRAILPLVFEQDVSQQIIRMFAFVMAGWSSVTDLQELKRHVSARTLRHLADDGGSEKIEDKIAFLKKKYDQLFQFDTSLKSRTAYIPKR